MKPATITDYNLPYFCFRFFSFFFLSLFVSFFFFFILVVTDAEEEIQDCREKAFLPIEPLSLSLSFSYILLPLKYK